MVLRSARRANKCLGTQPIDYEAHQKMQRLVNLRLTHRVDHAAGYKNRISFFGERIVKSHALRIAALLAISASAATSASAADFLFSFSNDVGNVSGMVTGEVFGLTDNATSSATSVLIYTWPAALIPAGNESTYPAPIDATSWSFQDGNSFTVVGGVVTSGAFHADNSTAVSVLDRLWLNFGPCSSGPTCSFLSLGSNDSQYVWTGVGGTTFCAPGGSCSTLGGSGGVPEPASWALMLGGFGLVGGAMRARRNAAVTFA